MSFSMATAQYVGLHDDAGQGRTPPATGRTRTNMSDELRFDGGRTRPLRPAGTFARVTRNAVIREHLGRGESHVIVSRWCGHPDEGDRSRPSIDVQAAPVLHVHGTKATGLSVLRAVLPQNLTYRAISYSCGLWGANQATASLETGERADVVAMEVLSPAADQIHHQQICDRPLHDVLARECRPSR